MALEYAKRKVWEKCGHVLNDQIYVFGKQFHTIDMLVGQVDVIVTDSPLLLSLAYSRDRNYYDELEKLVLKVYSNMDNINIFLTREKEYNSSGRMQTERQAEMMDKTIMKLLNAHGIKYITIPADSNVEDVVDEYIMEEYNGII